MTKFKLLFSDLERQSYYKSIKTIGTFICVEFSALN